MKYFALYNDGGNLITFGTTTAQTVVGEITAEEYDALKSAHTAKIAYAEQVIAGEITIDDVPEALREDVQAEVDFLQAADEEAAQNISAEEALNIILGGETA